MSPPSTDDHPPRHHTVEVEDPAARRQIEALAGMLPEMIREGTAQGLQSALAQPETWVAVAKGFREAARREAGTAVLNGLAALARKLLLFLAIGGLVYWIGGWAALAGLWKALSGSQS